MDIKQQAMKEFQEELDREQINIIKDKMRMSRGFFLKRLWKFLKTHKLRWVRDD